MYSVRALWGGHPLQVRAFGGPRARAEARAYFDSCQRPGGASEVQLARLDGGLWRVVARARRDGRGWWAELPVQAPVCAHAAAPEAPGTQPQLRVPVSPAGDAFLRWRCWAADVRDGRAPHRGAVPEAARRAALLARLLDAWAELAARAGRPDAAANLAEPLEGGICGLVGWLVLSGVRPPD